MKIKTSVTKPASGMKVKTDVKAGLYSPQDTCRIPPCVGGPPPIICPAC